MPVYPLKLNHLELALWLLQILLLALALRQKRRIATDRDTTYLACAFALLLAWNWRLIYGFALASSGFWYFVTDDPARFLLSWGWSRHPYFVTWDGIWQGGTFYLHGAAMRLTRDPMMASKLVSAFYGLLPLLGLFLLAQGLYRNRRFSIAVVLLSAPFWLHLLLGTGALAEMPVAGLMLGGVGLLLLSLHQSGRQRFRLELAAALAFFAATAFHVTAWMMLAPALLIWFGYSVSRRSVDPSALKRWFLFALVSCSYCAAWIIACWVKFGHPLKMFADYSQHVIRDLGGRLPLQQRIFAYPDAIAYSLWGIIPLLVIGLLLAFFRDTEEKYRVRWVLAGAGFTLLIMVVSAVRSDPNAHAYRSTVALATLLIPIAFSPLWPLAEEALSGSPQRWSRDRLLSAICLLLFAVSWIADNHQRTVREQRELDSLYSDSIGVGAWLRQEFVRPQLLQLTPASPPIRLWDPNPPVLADFGLLYAAGYPGRMESWSDPHSPGIDSMKPGQYLVANAPVSDPRMARVAEFGRYTVYRLQGK